MNSARRLLFDDGEVLVLVGQRNNDAGAAGNTILQMRQDGSEADIPEGFGTGLVGGKKVGGVRLGMDGLVPVVGALGIGFDLRGHAEEVKGICSAAGTSFGDGHPIIAIEIDKGGIDVFPAAIDDHGIFGDRNAGPRADDEAVPDDQGGVGKS